MSSVNLKFMKPSQYLSWQSLTISQIYMISPLHKSAEVTLANLQIIKLPTKWENLMFNILVVCGCLMKITVGALLI